MNRTVQVKYFEIGSIKTSSAFNRFELESVWFVVPGFYLLLRDQKIKVQTPIILPGTPVVSTITFSSFGAYRSCCDQINLTNHQNHSEELLAKHLMSLLQVLLQIQQWAQTGIQQRVIELQVQYSKGVQLEF